MSTENERTLAAVQEMVAARSNGAFLSATQPHADTLHFKIEKKAMRAWWRRLSTSCTRAS